MRPCGGGASLSSSFASRTPALASRAGPAARLRGLLAGRQQAHPTSPEVSASDSLLQSVSPRTTSGTLEISSEEGKGTSSQCSFPRPWLGRRDRRSTAGRASPQVVGELRGRPRRQVHIRWLDLSSFSWTTRPNIRATISFILEMEGFRVETAVDGEEGLEKIRALKPPVVLWTP